MTISSAVLESQGAVLPKHLRGLILAGLRSGRLAEVLEEYVELQHSQSELRRRIWLTLAYPFVLLIFMTALAAFAGVFVVPWFDKIFKDFGTALPTLTVAVINGSQPIMWFLISLVVLTFAVPLLLWLAPAASWVWALAYRLPFVGPLVRWSHLVQFARLLGLLLEQDVALPDALRITAAGLSNTRLGRVCRRVADEVETGRTLDECLAKQRQFPASLIPIIQWGERAPALPDAFRAAAEMFEGRVRSQGTLLEAMLLPIVFLAIVIFVGLFVVALFMPLISLITRLSG